MPKYDPKKTLKKKPRSVGYRDPKEMSEGFTEAYVNKYNLAQTKDRIAELKTAKEHSHSIVFRKFTGSQYRRASLQKQEGKYAKYWLLNAKQTNGNGWGVSPVSIAKNINKFIGRPFVVTAKQWIPESEYGEQFEHPYLPTNNIDNIISHQEKFRVGSIVDVVEKDGCSNCSPYSDSGIHCFAVTTNGRPINLFMFLAMDTGDTPHPLPLVCLAFNNQYLAYLPSCFCRLALLY
jgi:hypothetical protein